MGPSNPVMQIRGSEVMPNRIILKIGLLLVAATLAGCGTPEFRQERQICKAKWLQKIPPEYKDHVVMRTRYESRPDGNITCTTTGSTTQCSQGKILVPVPYMAVETYDINAERRAGKIKACTENRCTSKFGNPSCKT